MTVGCQRSKDLCLVYAVYWLILARHSESGDINGLFCSFLLLLINFFFVFFFLLSYHLYRLQRHCSRAARTGIPTTSLIQGSFRIAAPPQRSTRGDVKIVGGLPPQGDIAPLPLRWCSVVPVLPVVPVLIHHTQGDTYYAPY